MYSIPLGVYSLNVFRCCLLGLPLGACVAMPDVPSDFEFPTQEILRHAVCELRDAYRDLNDKSIYPAFHAADYSVKIVLQPKGRPRTFSQGWFHRQKQQFGEALFERMDGRSLSRRGSAWRRCRNPAATRMGAQASSLNRGSCFPLTWNLNARENWFRPQSTSWAVNLGLRSWLTRSSLAIENDLHQITSVAGRNAAQNSAVIAFSHLCSAVSSHLSISGSGRSL